MACVPTPDFPALPDISPLTLEPPALPGIDLSADFCCKFELISFTPFIPLDAAILAVPGATAVVLAINTAIASLQTYIDALPLKCPKDA